MTVVGEGILRVEESPFLEVEKPTMGSLQLMRRGVLGRPTSQINCGMQRSDESRTGRHCLESQMADSGLLESAEASPPRFSGLFWFWLNSGLFDKKAESGVNLPVMSFEKLKAESHS